MKRKNENIKTKKEQILEKVENYISVISSVLLALLGAIIPLTYHKFESVTFLIVLLFIIGIIIKILISYVEKNINNARKKSYDHIREGLEDEIIKIQNSLSLSEEQWKNSYHLILSSQIRNSGENDKAIRSLLFLKKFGLAEEDFIVNNNLIFYLTSFSEKYEPTYKICKDVCKEMSLMLLRGDEIEVTGDIFSQIIRYIVKSSLIIVNIDGKNPNVFYELGIAHALGKNIMLISKRNNKVPFDVQQYRTIFYNKNEELKQILPETIKKYLQQSRQNEFSRLDECIDCYQRILEIDPKNGSVIISLGRIYKEKHFFKEAEQCFFKALMIDKNNIYAYLELADLYETCGEHNKANEMYAHISKVDHKKNRVLLKLGEWLSKN